MEPGRAADAVPEVKDETDADLLVYMTMAADEPACARAAWAEFYRRHAKYVYRICLRAYRDVLGDEAAVADLVAEVFRAAYQNADKFDPAGVTDAAILSLRCRAWLGWVARRMVQDLLRGRGRLKARTLELEHWNRLPAQDRPRRTPTCAEQLVRQAILSLSDREQLVIRVTFQWHQTDRQHQRLPNAVAAELAQTLGTTAENLRQIRRRAMRKIESYIRLHERRTQTGDEPDE